MSADSNTQVMDRSLPQEENGPVPVWLIILGFILVYVGLVYFDEYGGWFHEQVYAPYRSYEQVLTWQPMPAGDDLTPLGKLVYNKPTCVTCHQADGNGTPGQFPPLASSDWVNEAEPGRLIRIVLNGLTGPITVNGKSFNSTMVPWKDQLSDKDVAAVITYVRQNKAWGNKAGAVKPEQVAKIRAALKDRAQAFTPDELLKISPAE
ncbi:MAG TPA: cytochrome c [Candidatus Dormibacteraeota bacterium]|nr:cytochrome c [Candidatus Dormibacteraeota bacterium]